MKISIVFPTNCEFIIYRLLSIDERVIYKVPTVQKLRALFDNYELDASDRETVTPHERHENDDFINAVLDTQVMQTAMKFLNKKGLHFFFTYNFK